MTNPYTAWVQSIHETEDATARAIEARDRLLALSTWLTWQKRRCRVNAQDADTALEDVQAGLDVVLSTIAALRSHRQQLSEGGKDVQHGR